MEDVGKVELHNHLEGTAPPALIRQIAQRNGVTLNDALISEDGSRFVWRDFLDFLDVYEQASMVIRSPQDYFDITHHYLMQCAREGCVYVEMLYSPEHAERASGVPSKEHMVAIGEAIDKAHADSGIYGGVIFTAVRHYGVAACEAVAMRAHTEPHPYLVGFGLAGDEKGFPAAQFATAFEVAADAELGCTAHAGEMDGPDSIRQALSLKGVSRLGHGVRAVEDSALLEEIRARGIHLEVCVSSNLALKVYPSYEAHPLLALIDSGVSLSLNSDDPPYFDCSVGGEYAIAEKEFGLSKEQLRNISKNALAASFAPEKIKDALFAKL